MQVSPQKDTSLLKRLNTLMDAPVPNELELKRIENEAQKLIKTPPGRALGYVALGIIATHKLNIDDILTYFNAAVQTSDEEGMLKNVLINKGYALQRVHHLVESADHFKAAHESVRDDIEYLWQAYQAANGVLRFNEAELFQQRLENLKVDWARFRNPSINEQSVEPFVKLVTSLGVTEDQLAERVDCASKYLFSCGHQFKGCFYTVLDSGELCYQFSLSVSDEEAAQLSFDLAMHMIESFDDPLESIVTFSCISDAHITPEFDRA